MNTLLLCLLMFGNTVFAKTLNIEFQDQAGHEYKTQTFAEEYAKSSGVNIEHPRFAIIEATSASSNFKKQMAILDSVGEKERLIIIEACIRPCNHSSYSVTSSETKNIKGFKITLLDGSGQILKTSNFPLSATDIQKTLNAAK